MQDPDGKIAAWLHGGFDGTPVDTRRESGIPAGANGILERLLVAFPGDPVTGAQTLNIGGGVLGLTPPDNALSAIVSIENVAARIFLDGKVPTTSVGLLVAAGTLLMVTGRPSLHGFQAVGIAAGSSMTVLYFT